MPMLSLSDYARLPRLGGLLLSRDGRRLVFPVREARADGSEFVTSIWELSTSGGGRPRRLTRSAEGESSPALLPDGSLLFASRRPAPSGRPGPGGQSLEGGPVRVWRLPAGGGEARPVLEVPSGVEAIVTARDAEVAVLRAQLFRGASDLEADAALARRRKERTVSAILFDQHPVRFWDHDLGPREPHLLGLAPVEACAEPRDLTPEPGMGVQEAEFALSPDGATVVTTWWRPVGRAQFDIQLVAIGGGAHRVLASGREYQYGSPAVSPDGGTVAALRTRRGTPESAERVSLVVMPIEGGEIRELAGELDLWPGAPVWSADGETIYFSADERGRKPIYSCDPVTGKARRLTEEDGFANLCPSPDGRWIYAIRSSYARPPELARVDLATGAVAPLPTPGPPLQLPGTVTEVSAAADDGVRIQGWLVMPPGASAESPAPLVLWVHGGPLSSWNEWHWRWNPHLLAERGYAVLLPDPALSTGYGQAFVQRAWGRWGDRVYRDVMALTDAVLERADLDGARTAMMGGSFGGYMANWIAGHTDRFRAIVSHASLWALRQFHATTDTPTLWEDQFGNPYEDSPEYEDPSPHRHIARIRTPMLVIHGAQDYRVPVSEALRLFTDLRRHGVPSQYLYFPDENHWILKPANGVLWYETVLAFLDHHVLGKPWTRPDLL